MQTNEGPAGRTATSGEAAGRAGIGGEPAGGGAVRRGFGVLMLVEAGTLAVAAILHLGAQIPLGFLTVRGTHQPDAAFPELIIAAALVAGSWAVFRFPDRARRAALAVNCFAVAGVILGLSITASGDGPAKAPNVAYHACLLAVLVTGLIALLRDAPPHAR
jgi:peptidoglycan/LPS O-acetylase OafA/YrhL